MVDLPQDQESRQTPTSDVPVGDQPPVEEKPTEEPKEPEKAPFPSKEEIAPPSEEGLKTKLSSLGIKPSESKKPPKKKKIVLAVLSLLFILASIPAAVYLVQQRQELRKEAAPGEIGDMTCIRDVVAGPGSYSFAAKGVGLKGKTSGTVNIQLPAGSTPLSSYAFAFWSGEKKGDPTNPGEITINGTSLKGIKIYHKYNSDWQNTGYIYYTNIPSSMISGTSLTFNVSVTAFTYIHGVGIVVPYEKPGLPSSKILIRSCGDFVYTGPHKERDDKSDPMTFDVSDISSEREDIRVALFFGEGEGAGANRPNYLYFNDARLDPSDGTPYPAYSTDGGWWDTRITGDDLPPINASGGKTLSFQAHSPQSDPAGHGESFYFIGGVAQYPVSPGNQPPECSGLRVESPIIQGETVEVSCPTNDPDGNLSHVEFWYGADNGSDFDYCTFYPCGTELAKPFPNCWKKIGVDQEGTTIWSVSWDTGDVPTDDYIVVANVFDTDNLWCTGNPSGTCGYATTSCPLCKNSTTIVPAITPTPPPKVTPTPTPTPAPQACTEPATVTVTEVEGEPQVIAEASIPYTYVAIRVTDQTDTDHYYVDPDVAQGPPWRWTFDIDVDIEAITEAVFLIDYYGEGSIGTECGSWQPTAQCEFCKVYDEDWKEITDLSTITVGQTVYFTTRGSTTHPGGITKARFRISINGVAGSWQETTSKHGDEFYIEYTISSAGSYTVESMVYNPTLGWR